MQSRSNKADDAQDAEQTVGLVWVVFSRLVLTETEGRAVLDTQETLRVNHLTGVFRQVFPVVFPASYAAGRHGDVSAQKGFQHLISAVDYHVVEGAYICWSGRVKGIDVYILLLVCTWKSDVACVDCLLTQQAV